MSRLESIREALDRELPGLTQLDSQEEADLAKQRLVQLSRELHSLQTRLAEDLETAQAQDDRPWWKRLKTSPQVEKQQGLIQLAGALEQRLDEALSQLQQHLAERGAKALLWRAENLLAGVPGTWTAKATVTAAALMAQREPEEVFEFVRTFSAALKSRWPQEELLIGAALLSGAPAAEAAQTVETLRDHLGEPGRNPLLIAASLNRAPDEAQAIIQALQRYVGRKGQLELAAALLSEAPLEQLEPLAAALHKDPPGASRYRRHAKLAALLVGLDPKALRDSLERWVPALVGDAKSDPLLLAAVLAREELEDEALLGRYSFLCKGQAIDAGLYSAALLSPRAFEDSEALIKRSQGKLSGGRESEVMVVGGALLAAPPGEETSKAQMIQVAYLLPGAFQVCAIKTV